MTHSIIICMGSSCSSRGNLENLEIIEDFLARHQLEVTVDLRGCLCQEQCQEGPVLLIDGELHKHVDRSCLEDILNRLFPRNEKASGESLASSGQKQGGER